MNTNVIIVFSVIAVMFIGFLLLKKSFWVVSTLALVVLMLTGILTPADAFSGFSNSNVIFVFCMIVVSSGLRKTRLISSVKSLLTRFLKHEKQASILVILVAFILAQLLSPVVVLSIMLPFVTAVNATFRDQGLNRLIYPIAVIADLTNSIVPIGMGATIAAQNNAMMASLGVTETLPVYNLFLNAALSSLLIILYFSLFYDKVLPKQPSNSVDTNGVLDLCGEEDETDPKKERMAYILFFATSTMILISAFRNWPLFYPALIGAILMLLTGVLTEREFFGGCPWGVIVLLATSLPLTNAISNTGAGDVIGNCLTSLLGHNASYVMILAVIYVFGTALTQIVSNGAAWYILVPLVTITSQKLGISPLGPVSIVEISAIASLFTPMASSTMAIAFSAGGYTIKDFLKAGFPAWLLMGISAIAVIALRYPV